MIQEKGSGVPVPRRALARYRKAAGYSQERLAERLRVERSTVARWERGETEPQPWHRPRLARALGMSPAELDRALRGGPAANDGSPPLAGALPHTVAMEAVVSPRAPTQADPSVGAQVWDADAVADLVDLGGGEAAVERRRLLHAAAYSAAALALPSDAWWPQMAHRARARTPTTTGVVRQGDVAAVRDMCSVFSRADQRRGGGHVSTAITRYLTTDVAAYLQGGFANDRVRADMFAVAGELAYLAGWTAFDSGRHAVGERYFTVGIRLAAEADDPALAGHILRAMAHQAIDLGRSHRALDLAAASVGERRYLLASPRERALLGVVHARALAVNGQPKAAAAAFLRAEDDLAAASPTDDEPGRVFFFGRAALAHETACGLRDAGDLVSAEHSFQESVVARKAASFARTHAVTLGYLGAVQLRLGRVDEACTSYRVALDAMEGVRSGRTTHIAAEICSLLRKHDGLQVSDVRSRAQEQLAASA